MRERLSRISRYIATPRVAKHRLFVWVGTDTLPDCQLIVFARDDDYFFGVLHSRLHEVWSLRMGTSLEDRPRYTPTTTFETFPFPWPPGQEPGSHPANGPHPWPLPQNEGGESATGVPSSLPSPLVGEGPGMGVLPGEGPGMGAFPEPDRWNIPPEMAYAMTRIARQLRKNPTPSEAILWLALQKRQLDGRKFRRQMPIGPFVVDFYCSSERLIVEVDGPIHESQRALDQERQTLLESLGLRFVRVTAAQVEADLPAVLRAIRAAFGPANSPHPWPLPQNEGGESATGVPSSLPSPLPSPRVGEGPGMGVLPGEGPGMGVLPGEGPGMGAVEAYLAISAAARQLHAERDAWLNPPGVDPSSAYLKSRTLTNLYNALNVWRGVETMRVPAEAADFAPRLADLHRVLDEAVCDAYGWPHDILADEEEILRRLLALNLERAGKKS